MKNTYIYICFAVFGYENLVGKWVLKMTGKKNEEQKIYIRLAVFGYELLEFGDTVNERNDVRKLAEDHQRPAVVVCVAINLNETSVLLTKPLCYELNLSTRGG